MLLVSLCTFGVVLVLLAGQFTQRKTQCLGSGFDNSWKFEIGIRIFIAFAIVLIGTSTLRYGWIDTYAYKEMYIASNGNLAYVNSAPYGVEAGWLYCCYLLNFISESPKLMLFLAAAIIVGAYVFIIKKYSCDPIFSLVIFFCVLYMDTNNGLRQMVAAAIIILGFPLLTSRKIGKYLAYAVMVMVAMQLHESAIVCLFVALVVIGKPFNGKVKLALVFGLVFILVPGIMNEYLGEIFSDSKYLNYLDMTGGMTFLRAFITGIFPAVLAIFYLRKCKRCCIRIDYVEGVLINVLLINSMFVIMGCYMQYWNRMGFYTAFAPFVLIPKLAYNMFLKAQRVKVKMMAIFLYFVFFAYNIYVNIGYGAVEDFYISWFN